MMVWIREVLGWVLIAVGLNIFRISFQYLASRQVVEASVAAFMGVFTFRYGIQMLKVALAARLYDSGRQKNGS